MKINIKEEAQRYFIAHYPEASEGEIKKQVEDWENKIDSGKGLVKFFTERVGFVEGKKTLDIGFGNGGIDIAFALAGAEISGVDIDQELKDIASRHAIANDLNIDFRLYNGSELPFDDNNFDYVICFSVLEHTSYPERLINEMFRVLRNNGKILLTLPNKYYPKETHTLAYFVSYMPRKMANIYLKLLGRSPLEHDNLHFYSYFDILKMLKKTEYKYELLYKDFSQTKGIKRFVALMLKKFNIHYTVFLKQLMFIVEKK